MRTTGSLQKLSSADLCAARDLFPGAKSSVYLNTAAEGLFGNHHNMALQRYGRDRTLGERGRRAHTQVEANCRQLAAELLGAGEDEIAFVASTSRGLDAAVESLRWTPGDNIVVSDSDFPGSGYIARKLAARGTEVRVATGHEGPSPEDLACLVDDRTRVVLIALVNWKTGYRHDLLRVAEIAHSHGAILVVDAAQALGAVPIDCAAIDFLAASAYKWLVGLHGIAVMYVNRRLNAATVPNYVGWRGVVSIFESSPFGSYELHEDARRFEEGMPNYPSMYGLECSLELLRVLGMENVAAHNAKLTQQLLDGLADIRTNVLTATDPARRASIVVLETPWAAEIASTLALRRIHVWGKDGRLRVAPHYYNTSADIERLLAALIPELTSRAIAA